MMGRLSVTEILVIGAVVLLLFGRGKVGALMGELGQGIRAFRTGLREDRLTPEERPEGGNGTV